MKSPLFREHRDGFTIVELLIVIVVVGILAAITIVAYNGIQTRAQNTTQINAASQSYKILQMYKQNKGSYPATTLLCMGENYTDTNGDGIADCGDNATSSMNAAAIADLKTTANVASLPSAITKKIVSSDGSARAGIFYRTSDMFMFYFLQGSNQDCGLSSVTVKGYKENVTWCGVPLQ